MNNFSIDDSEMHIQRYYIHFKSEAICSKLQEASDMKLASNINRRVHFHFHPQGTQFKPTVPLEPMWPYCDPEVEPSPLQIHQI